MVLENAALRDGLNFHMDALGSWLRRPVPSPDTQTRARFLNVVLGRWFRGDGFGAWLGAAFGGPLGRGPLAGVDPRQGRAPAHGRHRSLRDADARGAQGPERSSRRNEIGARRATSPRRKGGEPKGSRSCGSMSRRFLRRESLALH